MESSLTIGYLLGIGISVVVLICFFVLCSNIAKIKNSKNSDMAEYKFYKEIGDLDKAYYYLQRDFFFNGRRTLQYGDLEWYYTQFEEIGKGIPTFTEFENFKK